MSIFIRRHYFFSLTFLFTLIIILFTIIVANNQKKTYRSKAQETISPTPEASPSAHIALLETMIESKNIETDNLINKYEQTTDEEEKQNVVSSLENNLTERKNNLLSLLKLSSLSVYKKAFNKDKIEKLQKVGKIKDKKLTEEHIDEITGTVNTTIYDNFDDNTSYTTATFIPDDNEEEEINFYPTDHQTFLSGTKVVLDDAIRIDEDEKVLGISSVYAEEQQPQEKNNTPQSNLIAVEIQITVTPQLDTLGEQKMFVFLACLENLNCDELPSPKEIEQRINNEISQFFKRDSYNNMSLVVNTTNRWLKITKEIIVRAEQKYERLDIRKIILSEFAHDIKLKGYDRLAMILVAENKDIKGEGGVSSLGRGYNIKIADKTKQFSLLTVLASSNKDYFFSTAYHNQDGDMSYFDKVFSHEFIHSLGGDHADATNIYGNTFISIDKLKGSIEEYGNNFEIIGTPNFGLYSNAYIKKEFGWIGQNSEGNVIQIDIKKPAGRYRLKKMGSVGDIAAWLPYSSLYKEKTIDYLSHVDYFLEYRKTLQQSGLIVNLLETWPFSPALVHTILFPSSRPNGVLSPLYQKNDMFFDQLHQIKIEVNDIDDSSDILTFTIHPCQKNRFLNTSLFYLISDRAGNGKIASINIFENDLRGENNTTKPFTIKENFLIENTSLCFNKKYFIDQSATVINQGNLYLSTPQFNALSTEEVPPSQGLDNTFTTIATINNPTLPDTQMEFTVVEQNLDTDQTSNNDKQEQPISKKLIYQFHVVPSTEEYRNDLEPHMIDIKDKDINNKDFNHLETEKGQTLVLTSNIANNSRRAENENPSPKFRMIWYIQNDKGGNVIPPFNQPHAGIPPKTLDDANPTTLTWIIPQDLKAGDYKIILEVDSNNRLQEFNENNNMIFRYFSVVE